MCARSQTACATTDALIDAHFATTANATPIGLLENSNCSGFGTALSEKAGLLATAIATKRRLLISWDKPGYVFNRNGKLFAPDEDHAVYVNPRRLWRHLSAHGYPSYDSREDCLASVQHMQQTAWNISCNHGSEVTKKVGHVVDMDLNFDVLEERYGYSRFRHTFAKPFSLRSLVNSRPFVVISLDPLAPFLPEFIQHDESLSMETRNLGHGVHEFAGPACIVRSLVRRIAPGALRTLEKIFSGSAKLRAGALLVSLHIRRGDSAMFRECPTCVSANEPDVKGKDRVTLDELRQSLLAVKSGVDALRIRLKRDVEFFVASDTAAAVELARSVLGSVLTSPERAMHSTQTTKEWGDTASRKEAYKVAADFLGLALGDIVFVSASAFGGNAAKMGFGLEYSLSPGTTLDLSPSALRVLESSLSGASSKRV